MNKKFVALAAALLLGAASAQTAPAAGTKITNTATATYDDPKNPGTPAKPVPSNPVTTTVRAVPDFTITYSDKNPDYQRPNSKGTPGSLTPVNNPKNAVPGQTVGFKYNVENTGNTPIIVQLNPKDSGTKDSTVTYGPDNKDDFEVVYKHNGETLTDTNGDGLVELPPLQPGEKIEITQEYTVPMGAEPNPDKPLGANPVGTHVYFDPDSTDNTTVTTNNEIITNEDGSPKEDKNNYNQVTVVEPSLEGDFKFAKFVSGSTDTDAQPNGVKVPDTLPGTFKDKTKQSYGTKGGIVDPGQDLTYLLVADNSFNKPLKDFKICDTVPKNTTFTGVQTALKNSTGYQNVKTIYKVGNTAWQEDEPKSVAANTTICVAIDDDSAGFNTGSLPAKSQYLVEFSAKVDGKASTTTNP